MSPLVKRMRSAGSLRSALALVAALLLVPALAQRAGAQPAWSQKPERSNAGEVQFVLTPRDVAGGRFRVDIVVTTHSGDLASLDLSTAAELRVDGQTLRPVKAPALRGHHVRGRLEFALARLPETFEIVIRGVRALGDLTFRWP
jgi:hypothetical protein